VILHHFLLSKVVFYLSQHNSFFLLNCLFLFLYQYLNLINLLLFEHFCFLLNLLNFLFHPCCGILVFLMINFLILLLNFSNLFKFNLSYIFVYLFKFVLIILLKFLLFELNSTPNFLNLRLELFFKFLQLIFIKEESWRFWLNIKVYWHVVTLNIKWIVWLENDGLGTWFGST